MNIKELKYNKCECGFQFAQAGEFRYATVYMDNDNQWHIVCPECKREYDTD